VRDLDDRHRDPLARIRPQGPRRDDRAPAADPAGTDPRGAEITAVRRVHRRSLRRDRAVVDLVGVDLGPVVRGRDRAVRGLAPAVRVNHRATAREAVKGRNHPVDGFFARLNVQEDSLWSCDQISRRSLPC
jgi:hypothetical protein